MEHKDHYILHSQYAILVLRMKAGMFVYFLKVI